MNKNSVFITLLKKHTDIDKKFIDVFFKKFKIGGELNFDIKDKYVANYLGIELIIRGHSDSFANSTLLVNGLPTDNGLFDIFITDVINTIFILIVYYAILKLFFPFCFETMKYK